MAGSLLETSHSHFTLPSSSSSKQSIHTLLRGVNLSSTAKYPTLPGWDASPSSKDGSKDHEDRRQKARMGMRSHLGEKEGFWSDAESGGRDGWFVGRPLMMDEADVHLRRLRAYGFTTLRYLITWEALEHAGPGKYDEAFIDYTISLLRKCKAYDFKVFISPHQDVFSRFISGTGAPYWVLLALGIHPRRIQQTASGVLHSCWEREGHGGIEGRDEGQKGKVGDWPDMIWNTNLHRLAARHCFTMFYASEVFAPKCTIDGRPAGKYLRDHFDAAYGHLADRLRDAGGLLDDCVIGWDSMNEPSNGFIETPDLSEFPPSQSFRKGASPTPIQGFLLGQGKPVSNVQVADFTSLGQKTKGNIHITPPDGDAVWLTRTEAKEAGERWGWKWGDEWDFWDEDGKGGCVWAGHKVWDPKTGMLLQPAYFHKKPEGQEWKFIEDFWRSHYISFISRIRQAHPNAISFVNPPVFEEPPDLSEGVKSGRVALSAHFYDGLTLLAKRRHKFNADAVGLQRGIVSLFNAIKIGPPSIQTSLHAQLKELKGDAKKSEGIAGEAAKNEYPTIIGEIGVPFDMKKSGLFGLASGKDHRKDYRQVAKSMNETLNACDGKNALSYTLWVYEPTNTWAHGDGWNGEDLSLISLDDARNKTNDKEQWSLFQNPPDMSTLMTLGARAIESWCRPYPVEYVGVIVEFGFEMDKGVFELVIDTGPSTSGTSGEQGGEEGWAKVYLPYVHYRQVKALPPSDTVSPTSPVSNQTSTSKSARTSRRLVGHPTKKFVPASDDAARKVMDEDEGGGMEEWTKGDGPARVDLEILEITAGKLEVEGQFGKWVYELGQGVIRLTICPWREDV